MRCLRGAVFDVVVDLRAGLADALRWLALELSRRPRATRVYVPAGCAHGFLTLEDACELEYLISDAIRARCRRGSALGRPVRRASSGRPQPVVISPRDAAFPDLDATRVHREGPRPSRRPMKSS